MTADFVAPAGYLSDELGMLFSHVADDEESGASFMGVEQIEESVSTSLDRLGYPADASRQPAQHPLVPVLEINRQSVMSGRLFWQARRPLLRRQIDAVKVRPRRTPFTFIPSSGDLGRSRCHHVVRPMPGASMNQNFGKRADDWTLSSFSETLQPPSFGKPA